MAISHIRDICIDCSDPHRVAHFWAAVLGYTTQPTDAAPPPDESIALHPQKAGSVSGVIECPSQRSARTVSISTLISPTGRRWCVCNALAPASCRRSAMRKAAYAGRSWPILRGMSSVPFSPHSTWRHARALESEVLTRCVTIVCRAARAAPLQLGHHEGREVVTTFQAARPLLT
jgi:hypothetical protein